MFPMEDYPQNYTPEIPSKYHTPHHQPHLFQQEYSQEAKLDKKTNKLIPPKKIRKNYWKPDQNKLYIEFLQENQDLFMKSVKQRTGLKVNVRMSNFVKSRNPTQCRSHHQKMIKKYLTVPGIMNYLRKQIREGQNDSELRVSNILQFQIMLQKGEDYQQMNQMSQYSNSNEIIILRSFLE